MKKKLYSMMAILMIATSIFCQQANAQAPQGIPYQAVARDNAGNLIKNQPISLRFSIHDGTASGTVVYSETHSVTTDALGLFSVNIGGGTSSSTLANVNWGSGSKFTQVELDVAGGSNYIDMGTTQMMSVPYALYAGSAGTSMGAIAASSNANGAAFNSGVLSLAPADGTNGGIVTSSAQTFGGKKNFADSVVALGFRATDSLTTKGFRATGTATANSFVKINGTASQYLMADGSISTVSSAPVAMPTIQIGNQLWSKNNLDVSFYRNGDEIPYVDNATAWAALTTGAWCYYNNDPANGEKYGKLYNWYAVKDARGLAPQGWHIPSDDEWTTLTTKLGGETNAAGKMKTAGTTDWITPNTGATNSSGFAGLPGGYRNNVGAFYNFGYNGGWWSSTETESVTTNAWIYGLYYTNSFVYRTSNTKSYGVTIRCLRD